MLEFRLKATKIYRECYKITTEDLNCMPTLLQILYHMEPLKYEIETIASIYRMVDIGKYFFCSSLTTRRKSSVTRHPSSIIRHPSSVIRHQSSDIRHPSSVIRHPSSVIRHRHSSFVTCHPIFVIRLWAVKRSNKYRIDR